MSRTERREVRQLKMLCDAGYHLRMRGLSPPPQEPPRCACGSKDMELVTQFLKSGPTPEVRRYHCNSCGRIETVEVI